jgi:hypothetical protein
MKKHRIKINYILINVNIVKPGLVVLIDKAFGIIKEVNKESNKATVITIFDEVREYFIEELQNCIVKFLAIMKDLNSFPIIHGDFIKIIYSFDSPEKMVRYIDGVLEYTGEGTLDEILSYPKVDDVVELISLKKAEELKLIGKENRIGVVTKIKENIFTVKLASKQNTINLKRAEFKVLSGIDSKRVFKLKE